jgi:hypothetical protein
MNMDDISVSLRYCSALAVAAVDLAAVAAVNELKEVTFASK